ncbi:hypothetical protein B0H14DRAFT_3489839 [Mycena olivaceomarginata]|nr:hypothetical protein B0H14DRAFT_3489839 [Mycena olivaceomarginata]
MLRSGGTNPNAPGAGLRPGERPFAAPKPPCRKVDIARTEPWKWPNVSQENPPERPVAGGTAMRAQMAGKQRAGGVPDVILLERGEEHATLETTFKRGFPWKWSPATVKHQLRIENWPTTLKATLPGPGFDLSHIKDGDAPADTSRNKAMQEMHGQLKSVYLGTEDASGATTIVLWSDEEMGLDNPRDVPIITCADGTTLLTTALKR